MLVVNTLLAWILVLPATLGQDDLPLPRLVIMGRTGSGKSTLANVLLGQDPNCENCTFAVCDGVNSCTKETNFAVGKYLGFGPSFTVVDTPGFGDSNDEDTHLIDEMMEVLHTYVKGANAIMLLINGEDVRIDASLQQMMREMQALFGEKFWSNAVIGVSHWDFKAGSVAERNYTGKTEEWFMDEINGILNDKFHLNLTLDGPVKGIFIDAWSQQPWNTGDEDQQTAFGIESTKLWTFFENHEEFKFRTIGDVVEENQEMKAEIKWLNDVITKNISELKNELIPGVGSITAWLPDPTGKKMTANIPDGWQRCDGNKILDERSPFFGQSTPNLNGEKRFLRGGSDSEAADKEEHQLQDHSHDVTDNGHSHTGSTGSKSVVMDIYAGDVLDKDKGEEPYHTCHELETDYCYKQPYTSRSHSHSVSVDSHKAGISVGNVESSYNSGTETRPRNMAVIYIMRIF